MNTELETKTESNGCDRAQCGPVYRPRVDIVEAADETRIIADVPGAAGDQIDVRFEDGELALHVPVKPRAPESATPLAMEYGVGDYFRRFRVSDQIDASRIRAEYEDGVLTVHLPKAESAKPRKIAVKTA